jgi:alpha-L-fucosidase
MKKKIVVSILVFLFAFTSKVTAQHEMQKYYPPTDSLVIIKLHQWQDLKFGLLMHWGPYSEWGIVESWSICPEDLSWATGGSKKGISENYNDYVKEYEALQTTFNPVKFNPEKWAAAAKGAGMKYVIFTTKHHDGFCMFDSKYTDYKITDPNTPFSANPRSNIAKEIFAAFRKENLWTGAYFSKPDWHTEYYWWKKFPAVDRNCNYSIAKHPEEWKKFTEFTHHQIDELMTDYGKIDILWLDGGWVRKTSDEEVKNYLLETYEGSRWARNPQNQDIDMDAIVAKARLKQPDLLVVDRAVEGPNQNYLTPEQQVPDKPLSYPWETCMTMATSWSYVPNDTYKPTRQLLHTLCTIVSRGGNLLLNIGPGPDGDFDPVAYQRLDEIGKWMSVNSAAIYASKPVAPYQSGNVVFTTVGKAVYAIYLAAENEKTLPAMIKISNWTPPHGSKATLVGSNKTLAWKSTNGNTDIMIPTTMRNHPPSDYAWVVKFEL